MLEFAASVFPPRHFGFMAYAQQSNVQHQFARGPGISRTDLTIDDLGGQVSREDAGGGQFPVQGEPGNAIRVHSR